MLVGKLSGTGSLNGTLSGTGSLRGTLSGGGVGHGIPSGGEPGQGLIKVSDTDYDVKWMDILPEDTASGSVASFPDGADDLPMGVVVDIDPVQDLHGYDNPWPGGGGKNLLNLNTNVTVLTGSVPSAVTITSGDGTATITETYYNRDTNKFGWEFKTEENQEYAISGLLQSTASVAIKVYSADGGLVASYNQSANSQINYTFNSGSNTTLYFYASISSWGQTITLSNVQIEKGTATAYAPYSNICPISGRTGAKVTRTGRNLYSRENGEYNVPVFDANGGTASYRDVNAVWIKVSPNTNYTVSNGGTISRTYYVRWINCDKSKKFISRPGGTYASSSLPVTFTTPSNCEWVELAINQYDWSNLSENDWIVQVEKGSTATAYEPYQGVTHEIPFSTSVYGGKLNVTTGELVVDRAKVVFDGTQLIGVANWRANSESVGWLYPLKSTPNIITDTLVETNLDNIVSDTLKTVVYGGSSGLYGTNIPSISVIGGTNWGIGMRMNDTSLTTNAAINSWLSQHPVTVVYKLASPITLTIDTAEIRSLSGDNNVFADTGDVSVTYKADIQKYIDKKISAAVAAMS